LRGPECPSRAGRPTAAALEPSGFQSLLAEADHSYYSVLFVSK
jgi:hypothetical protein